MTVGTNISVHENSYIDCSGGLEIGNSVAISHNCSILTFDQVIDQKDTSIKDAGTVIDPVFLGSNVWLGAVSRVLKGVKIMDGCVLAAGSVINKDTQENRIYAGVPAKLIRKRIE